MKALILDGSTKKERVLDNVTKHMTDYLGANHYQINVRILRDEKIAGCLGCFGCWLKTPGQCIITDDASDLPKNIMQSDLVILLTPVTFGMYSPELKKAYDRFACPLLLPFFEKISGEIHHVARYKKYPSFIAIGTLTNPDEESENTFRTLAARNGINLHTKITSSIIYSTDNPSEIKEKLIHALSKAGA